MGGIWRRGPALGRSRVLKGGDAWGAGMQGTLGSFGDLGLHTPLNPSPYRVEGLGFRV